MLPPGPGGKEFFGAALIVRCYGLGSEGQRTKFRCWLPPNKKLAKQFVDSAQGDCELVGVVVGRHFELLEKAVDAYRRKLFFEQLNAGYAELRADPEAWAEHLAERKLWDAALMDGLDPDERWTEDGRPLTPEEGKS